MDDIKICYRLDKEKIIAHFGMEFYNKVLNDLSKYASLWGLSDFEQVDYYSVNCIFKCISKLHGPCVLKIGNSSKAAKTEYQILNEYKSRRFCKSYNADISNGVLLIERIIPGTQLRSEPDISRRLNIFCDLFQTLHIRPSIKSDYPTYIDWVARITEYMQNRKDFEYLYRSMAKAEQICLDLCEKYNGEMLLHGDLHHDNILLDKDNNYRIIDPKGVVGDIVFDIPRFILNEFEDKIDDDFYNKFILITRTLSQKLNIAEFDIRRLVYVETCMASCWSVESGQSPNMNDFLFVEKLMNE